MIRRPGSERGLRTVWVAAAAATAAATIGAVAVLGARRRDGSSPRDGSRPRDGLCRRGAGSATTSVLPTQRTQRTAQMARIGARTGTDFAAMKARSLGASEDRRNELRAAFELRTAEQVTEALGNMKGALMKLGQMASYLDQGLPEPVREALAQLQSDAPPMSADLVAQVIVEELGAAPEEVFADWDPSPIASASIGQVHRARTHDGASVAVKVQYPGVADAVASDLENSDLLFQMMGVLFPGLDPKPIVDELQERLVEELDYRIEADNQQLFADAYVDHPFFHVPTVHHALSTARVLTTEFAEGARFSEVVGWSDHERQLAAECLFRFAFGGIYQLHAFNGDPHPGNYLFRPGGHITFLDFGLCKRFTDAEVDTFEDMIRAMVLDRDLVEFRRLVDEVGILDPSYQADDAKLFDYFGHFYEFVMEDGEQTITPEYSSESVRRFFDLSGPHADIMKAANLPASMVIVQRINLGLFALFGDLRATANWRRIAEEIWPFADGAPSTPMGEEIARWAESRTD